MCCFSPTFVSSIFNASFCMCSTLCPMHVSSRKITKIYTHINSFSIFIFLWKKYASVLEEQPVKLRILIFLYTHFPVDRKAVWHTDKPKNNRPKISLAIPHVLETGGLKMHHIKNNLLMFHVETSLYLNALRNFGN